MCLLMAFFMSFALGCSDEVLEIQENVAVEPVAEEAPVIQYVDWSEDQTGTSAKPAFGKGCRYRASVESVWELAADGADDHMTLSGEAAGEVNVSFTAHVDGSAVMVATAALQRVLSGKAYYEAEGNLSFSDAPDETWSIIDGTLCFESSLMTSTTALDAEFSFIARLDGQETLRTVGGTFVLPADKMSEGTSLAISDEAIALDLR